MALPPSVRIPDEILPPIQDSSSRRGARARRPSRRRQRRRRRLAALTGAAALVVLLVGAAATWDEAALPVPVPLGRPRVQALRPAPVAERRVYPYSVVAGGVQDASELARAMAADPVVAEHYRGVDLGQLRLATVSAPRAVHVSYRRSGRVYWTRRKVVLQPGETVLSDGVREARARCANQIADEPLGEADPNEPPIEVLDEPLPLTPPQHGGFVPLRANDLFIQANQLPALTSGGLWDVSDPIGLYAFVLPRPTWVVDPAWLKTPWTVSIDPEITSLEASPESVDSREVPGEPESAPVPEPGTLALLGAGCAALVAHGLRKYRRTA